MKAYEVVDVYIHEFFTSGLMARFALRPLYHQQRTADAYEIGG
jgi:hypothetical protein